MIHMKCQDLFSLKKLIKKIRMSSAKILSSTERLIKYQLNLLQIAGPSCSKLTMSLVNNSLKFTSSDTQIC